MIGQYDNSIPGQFGRDTFKFFLKTIQKKKNLKRVMDDVLPTLKSINEVDSLPVPKWSKKWFRYYYATKIMGLPTIEQIFANMQIEGQTPIVTVYRYVGSEIVNVGKNPIEVDPLDYITIMPDSMININHHPIKGSFSDISHLPLELIGEMQYEEKISIISKHLETKYSTLV